MRVLVLIFFCIITQNIRGQKNTIFLELGGQGGFTSLNYERQFKNQLSGFGIRTGIGATVFDFEPNKSTSNATAGCTICGVKIEAPRVSLTLPIAILYQYHLKNNNYVEIGVGTTSQFMKNPILVHHAALGFKRFFGREKSWVWKINFTPIIGVTGEGVKKDSEPTVWGAIAVGKRF